jgi:hypothetical protein
LSPVIYSTPKSWSRVTLHFEGEAGTGRSVMLIPHWPLSKPANVPDDAAAVHFDAADVPVAFSQNGRIGSWLFGSLKLDHYLLADGSYIGSTVILTGHEIGHLDAQGKEIGHTDIPCWGWKFCHHALPWQTLSVAHLGGAIQLNASALVGQ